MYPYNSEHSHDNDDIHDMQRPGFPGQPPFGRPPQMHQRPPFFDDGDRQPGGPGKPPGPPPAYTPREKSGAGLYAVDPGSIRGCLYNYTYVWLSNGSSFWMYPTHVGRTSISGYRWGRFGWAYVGFDLNMVESFSCSPY